MYLAERIMFQIDDILNEDMLNEYYHLPKKYMKPFTNSNLKI